MYRIDELHCFVSIVIAQQLQSSREWQCPGCRSCYLHPASGQLHCTCGLTLVEPPTQQSGYFADAMLGRLARWLRLLGIDTAYEAHIQDAELIRRARQEQRCIISRDRGLAYERTPEQLYLLRETDPLKQLTELVERFSLTPQAAPFSRCAHCNGELRPARRPLPEDRVPADIQRGGGAIRHCPRCGHYYWAGSHVPRIMKALEQACGTPLLTGSIDSE